MNHSKYSRDCEPTKDSDAFTLAKESNIMKEGEMRRYMIMPLMEKEHYTIEDIYALPEGERAELIDGQMYMMSPPGRRHQLLSTYLLTEISLYIRSKKGTCEVYAAPFGVFLKNEKGEDDYLEPDIVVVCDLDKLDEKGCHGAPDWVIEIVSPSSKKRDYLKKTAIYMEQGVREYWIVDPMREVTVVYKCEEEGFPVIYKFGESVKAGIYEELEITIK